MSTAGNVPMREALAKFLEDHRDHLLGGFREAVRSDADLTPVEQFQNTPDYERGVATLLRLLAQNASQPHDRRCFAYARRYAHDHYRQDIPVETLLRLAGLYRELVLPLLQEKFKDDPVALQHMEEVLDQQATELEAVFSQAYGSARDRQWQASESKYFWLFENASEAIFSFRPGEGVIIEANAQAERLTGHPRTVLMGLALPQIFAEEHRASVEWLITRPADHAAVRLDDLAVLRHSNHSNNGDAARTTPVSLSCNWLQVDGDSVAQVMLRDVTGLRQAQRELQSHAEELEARVQARTAELRASEERFRGLFLQEQRRARHLSLINEVQKCALATRDTESFLPQVTRAIQSHFSDCDVAFFLSEAGRYGVSLLWTDSENLRAGEMVLVAAAGESGLNPLVGSRRTLHDVSHLSPGAIFHQDSKSFLHVPVVIERETVGLVTVQSRQPEVLDARDVSALQTAAAIVASHLQSSRMFRNMRELNDFNQSLLNSMMHSLLVVDNAGQIQFVNERLCLTFGRTRDKLLKHDFTEIVTESTLRHYKLREVTLEVMETGVPREVPEVHVRGVDSVQIFDVRIFRVYFRGEAEAALLLINLTQRWRKTYQLQLMHEIGGLFQLSLDIKRVLSTVLTCITAGSALGFNRAFVFLHDENRDEFYGAMALGPSSPEEASRIWKEISQRELSLAEILNQVEERLNEEPSALQRRVMGLRLEAKNPCFEPILRTLDESHAVSLTRQELLRPDHPLAEDRHRNECRQAADLFTAATVAIAPLVAKDKVVGLVFADNLYSGQPIEADDVQLLDTLAHQAGLTIDNALTYQALQKAQKELVSAERLVAVGEMAARVSHEIRNPLATIGGFARSVLRKPDDVESVKRKVGVVVNEVARLEELLTDLLDMARPRQLDLQPHSVNEILEYALLLADSDIRAAGATVERRLAPDLPPIPADRSRLLQALLNTVRNGAQAMPNGGTLRVSTQMVRHTPDGPRWVEVKIADTGTGISERALKQVFDPFFSTKVTGSGLGLAVTKRIIQDHGGQIDVDTEVGAGTTFRFTLPVDRPAPAIAAVEAPEPAEAAPAINS